MIVETDKAGSGVVTVRLTTEEFAQLRYALDAGVDKLETLASYLKVLKSTEYAGAAKVATRARAVAAALESAAALAAREPTAPPAPPPSPLEFSS